jgi:hypothetical protein
MIVLTLQERTKFVDWLRQEIELERKLLIHMKKVLANNIIEIYAQKIAAKILVLKELSSIEEK